MMEYYDETIPVPRSDDPDTEPKIMIDADLRTITVPDGLVTIGVVGDHYAETVYFDCPRYFDGTDLSTKKCEIRFVNAAGYEGISQAVDMIPGESRLTFGWEIDRRATLKSGKISFGVFFCSTDGRGYQYGTTTAMLSVLNGLEDGLIITDQDNTLLLQIQHQLSDIQNRVSHLQNDILNLQTADITTTNTINLLDGNVEKLKDDINFLTDNVIYTSDVRS